MDERGDKQTATTISKTVNWIASDCGLPQFNPTYTGE